MILFSVISFGIVRDDLVTSIVECARSGTATIYKTGPRDLDVEMQAHRGFTIIFSAVLGYPSMCFFRRIFDTLSLIDILIEKVHISSY